MFVIRPYAESDQPAVWSLHNLALENANAHGGNGPWDDDLKAIPAHYMHSGGTFLVGLDGDQIVAMGALQRVEATTGEIKRMRVAPHCQRRGYGAAILHALEDEARSLGIIRLVLDTTDLQMAAQRLYEKHGYRETSRGRMGRFNMIYYTKELQAIT